MHNPVALVGLGTRLMEEEGGLIQVSGLVVVEEVVVDMVHLAMIRRLRTASIPVLRDKPRGAGVPGFGPAWLVVPPQRIWPEIAGTDSKDYAIPIEVVAVAVAAAVTGIQDRGQVRAAEVQITAWRRPHRRGDHPAG